ncbi:unnamed protein product [Closterium sp. Naga37s-1]|nr:unnamed protein product [Closterium sp. Naga37s-1]
MRLGPSRLYSQTPPFYPPPILPPSPPFSPLPPHSTLPPFSSPPFYPPDILPPYPPSGDSSMCGGAGGAEGIPFVAGDSSMCGGAGGAEGFSVVAGENPPGEREGRAAGACQPCGRPASPAALQHPGGSSHTAASHHQHRPPPSLHRAEAATLLPLIASTALLRHFTERHESSRTLAGMLCTSLSEPSGLPLEQQHTSQCLQALAQAIRVFLDNTAMLLCKLESQCESHGMRLLELKRCIQLIAHRVRVLTPVPIADGGRVLEPIPIADGGRVLEPIPIADGGRVLEPIVSGWVLDLSLYPWQLSRCNHFPQCSPLCVAVPCPTAHSGRREGSRAHRERLGLGSLTLSLAAQSVQPFPPMLPSVCCRAVPHSP